MEAIVELFLWKLFSRKYTDLVYGEMGFESAAITHGNLLRFRVVSHLMSSSVVLKSSEVRQNRSPICAQFPITWISRPTTKRKEQEIKPQKHLVKGKHVETKHFTRKECHKNREAGNLVPRYSITSIKISPRVLIRPFQNGYFISTICRFYRRVFYCIQVSIASASYKHWPFAEVE